MAQVIVAKWADHQPLHRQEKMFERHGIDISRKTMGGMAQCAELPRSFVPGRAGPAKFLEGYNKGYLQAVAYSVYDAFFKTQRGMTEVGCWMHARRYFFKALD